MTRDFYPGQTIGIIGASIPSALLAQAAGRLGYRVASLVLEDVNPVRQFASWQTVAESYNDQALTYFAERVDLVMVELGLLSNRSFQLLNKLTEVTLSDDLIAITTDRLIEKAYLDNHQCLVAPYSLVTNIEDIKEAVEYLGFPCVLKASQRNVAQADDNLILYSTEDYPAAQAKLEIGTCILEAWIPVEHKASLTIVRNQQGETLLYPIFEEVSQGDVSGSQVRFPVSLPAFIQEEIERIGFELAQKLSLVGATTLKVFITSADVIYVNGATIGLGQEAIFTLGTTSMDQFQATVRASLGLPLPELRIMAKAAISIPLNQLNQEQVLTQYRLRNDWHFALFNPMGSDPDKLSGYVVVTGDSLASCERQIEITELMA
ncbi:ATP-grasp domain-containing protein [Eremococcus coleocola]|uniref:ATP-grasp domain-containing protein n=1 Tax=Eremococcus coleocola TaxID=88132 RepID=UPI00040B2587|nr:ATP-grasp domain-containing protein [Eremococcus coleocola]